MKLETAIANECVHMYLHVIKHAHRHYYFCIPNRETPTQLFSYNLRRYPVYINQYISQFTVISSYLLKLVN